MPAGFDLPPARLNQLDTRLDPADWTMPLSRRDASPQDDLAPILAPLAQALAEGTIATGDFVAVALDHPVYAVPVHYRDIAGRLAVEHFGFSRVASHEYMWRIAESPRGTVASAAALFIDDSRIAASPLDPETSVAGPRVLLTAACRVLDLRAGVTAAIEHPRDAKLKAGPTLSVGTLAIALMLVASTEADIGLGPVKIHKEAMRAETILAFVKLVGVVRGQVAAPRP